MTTAPAVSAAALSARQARMLACIRQFRAAHRYSPSYREIMDACAIPSSSVVGYNLNRLQAHGLLTHQAGISRTVVLADEWGQAP